MSNPVNLDNVTHKDLRIRAERGPMFGDNINQVLVFPNEFVNLQREYPIFFRKDDKGDFQAVAMLGLDRDENLFLDGVNWQARYIPAVQARGPFSIVLAKKDDTGGGAEPMIRIDMDSPAVNEAEGYPLFLEQGGYAPYLNHIIEVLRTLHTGVDYAREYFAALVEHDLIEPVTAEIKLSDTEQYSLPEIYSISQEKLFGLSADALHHLHKAGFLAPSYMVLASMDNVHRLVEMKRRTR